MKTAQLVTDASQLVGFVMDMVFGAMEPTSTAIDSDPQFPRTATSSLLC
jgi:hypothetical protein